LKKCVFVVGAPGVGKSAAVSALVAGLSKSLEVVGRTKVTTYSLGGRLVAAELGHRTGPYPGCDTLPMDAVVYAAKDVATLASPVLLSDGDRLSVDRFCGDLLACGYSLSCVLLEAARPVLAARRAARGSKQAEGWAAGRETKAARFAEALGGVRVAADALAPQEVARAIWRASGGLPWPCP